MADAPRARKIADRIKVVIAGNLGSLVKDPRLGFVTITDVRVTNDLQHASVFYTVFGDETARTESTEALAEHKGRIRSFVGKQLGIRLTPTLEFILDAVPENAAHLGELLEEAAKRDAELAAARQQASYAGDADPYKKPRTEDEGLDEDLDDEGADGHALGGEDADARG